MKIFVTFIFLIIILINSYCMAQSKLDTVYILFDKSILTMKKGGGLYVKKNQNKTIKVYSVSYLIAEKVKPNPEMLDTGYWFSHIERTPSEIEIFGGPKNPITLIKDLDFLNKIKPLDHHFFENTEYLKVCKTFEAEDSWEQDVIIFIIDKDEIKDGKVVLREVTFSRPAKE